MKYFALMTAGICALAAGVAGSRTTWCGSDAWIDAPSAHVLVCPQGDGQSLAEAGATIHVLVINDQGDPTPSMPPGDIWVLGCDEAWTTLCTPLISAIDADAPTDANGLTTVSGAIRAGGSGTGLWVVVGGSIATGEWPACADFICLPITVVSPDMNGDLTVDLTDVSLFASAWPPQPYSAASDMNGDGTINLVDVSLFARHLYHGCQP